jgi:hypothetical protein
VHNTKKILKANFAIDERLPLNILLHFRDKVHTCSALVTTEGFEQSWIQKKNSQKHAPHCMLTDFGVSASLLKSHTQGSLVPRDREKVCDLWEAFPVLLLSGVGKSAKHGQGLNKNPQGAT